MFESIPVRNMYNEIIGYMVDYGSHMEVKDKNFQIVGRVIDGHTRDVYGNIVSFLPNPGLLLRDLE